MQVHALAFLIIGCVVVLNGCQRPKSVREVSWQALSLTYEQRLDLVEKQIHQVDLNLEQQRMMQERYILVGDFVRARKTLECQEQLLEQKHVLEQEKQTLLKRLKKDS